MMAIQIELDLRFLIEKNRRHIRQYVEDFLIEEIAKIANLGSQRSHLRV